MKINKKLIYVILLVVLVICFPLTIFAHPGRTDSSGGHHDYKTKVD